MKKIIQLDSLKIGKDGGFAVDSNMDWNIKPINSSKASNGNCGNASKCGDSTNVDCSNNYDCGGSHNADCSGGQLPN